MRTQTIGLQLLAMQERMDSTADAVHQCITAAEEAQVIEIEELRLASPGQVAQALGNLVELREVPRGWEMADVMAVARAYSVGQLKPAINKSTGAASVAYRCTLPHITNRRSVQAFVACVAVGVLRGYIDVKDANSLLFAAQAALTAFPKRKPSAGRK